MSFREPSDSLDQLTQQVIGACMEVHRHLGPGYSEAVYEEAVALELELRGIPYQRQLPVAVTYKGVVVGYGRLDLLIADSLVLELKAVDAISSLHVRQAVSYLKTTGKKRGIIVNFNTTRLRDGLRRVLNTHPVALPTPTPP